MEQPAPTADRSVVLAVVISLAVIALTGLVGVIVLIDRNVPAEALLAITGIASPAAGALAAVLATTRTQAPAVNAARVEGYNEAVAEVTALDPPAVVVVDTAARPPV